MSEEGPINSQSLEYLERLLAERQHGSGDASSAWQQRLQEWSDGNGEQQTTATAPDFDPPNLFSGETMSGDKTPGMSSPMPANTVNNAESLQDRVDQLVRNFRVRGHLIADLDPLQAEKPELPELDPAFFGFGEGDLERRFSTFSIHGANSLTLREIIERLRNTYCRSIGVQFMHIDDTRLRDWLQRRMEGTENRLQIDRDVQVRILTQLTDAVIFEEFVRKKYVGAKTYSLEGAESLIPLLDLAIEKAASQGVVEVVMAMAHRGRLNVLETIVGKRPQEIFWEFRDPDPDRHRGAGDVKYHLGYSGDWQSRVGHRVHISLCFNPSHLEFVNPVALGRARAKQDRAGDVRREQCLPLIIHGDASFAGEGIVQETLNLSQLPAYETGGALHVIVNNQVGFTTPPEEGRSSKYCTDVAKLLQSPIFHVNGEDPEAVAQVVELAMDFRREFRRDVVIDMYCYRRWGHNEGDEPGFTQPQMYEKISKQESVRDGYLRHLLELNGITREEADEIAERRRTRLEREFELAQEPGYGYGDSKPRGVWQGYFGGQEPEQETNTQVDRDRLALLLKKMAHVPEGLNVHRKLQWGIERRKKMAAGEEPIDWSAAEGLAIATLATAGHPVRISGEDTERGTFSQRHAVWHDVETGKRYRPYQHIAPDQAPVEIVNSPLSEAGVLGFEYGYSLDTPDALVMWEAQFGDFWNAAQVIVDQFIVSAEDKWNRLSGLVLLLPHGFEGQGPEHSSARLERLLLLAAEDNIQVVVPTTAAQYFHLLRRQVLRHWRKPLMVLTPKSLLRHPGVVSSLDELADGSFQRVLPDEEFEGDRPERVLLCAGKVYYDLLEAREERGRDDVAIVRVEQLFPFPEKLLAQMLDQFPDKTPLVWVQEEPANMGARPFLLSNYCTRLANRWKLHYVSRRASASPATGSHAAHDAEQAELIDEAFETQF